jgi:hypothetical protein
MRKFRVMVEGGNVALVSRRWFRHRRENFGFHTARYVLAEDEESAEALAIAVVRAELKDHGLSAFQGDTVVVRRGGIDELSSFGDALVPGRGFAFFREET